MLLAILVILLLVGNWLFSDLLVFYPLDFLKFSGTIGKWSLLLLLLALLGWGFKD